MLRFAFISLVKDFFSAIILLGFESGFLSFRIRAYCSQNFYLVRKSRESMNSELGEFDIGEPMDATEIPESMEIPEVPEFSEIPEIPEEPISLQEPEVYPEPVVAEEIETIEEPEVVVEPAAPEELEPIPEPPGVEEPEVQQAVEALGSMENLDPAVWDSLGPDERLETMQNIEDTMAEIQGRPPVTVVIDDTLDSNTFGGWNGETIAVNASHLDSDMPVDEFIDTIIHEGRHAYQDYAVDNQGFISNTDLVNSWAENRDNYLTPEQYGQEIYTTQPIEADAWGYATTIRDSLIANNWSES
jgi:hypothetical protein